MEDARNGNGGGNGGKSSGAGKKKGRKLTAAGKRKKKAALGKRTATATISTSTLPIKKRKISSNLSVKTDADETDKKTDKESSKSSDKESSKSSDKESSKSSIKPNPSETENNTDEGSSADPANLNEALPDSEENPTNVDSVPKNYQSVADKGDEKSSEDDDKIVTDLANEPNVETMVAIEVPKSNVSNASSSSTHRKQPSNPSGRKKGTIKASKKSPSTNRGRGKKKAVPLRKRNEKLLQKRGKKMLNKSEKMAAAVAKAVKTPPTIKVKSISTENRVVGKRGRKPHLTEEDKELALYKSLKKRLHKKLRAMVGFTKLEEDCFMCKEKGELIFCDNKKCAKGYHIACVKKLFKLPKGW